MEIRIFQSYKGDCLLIESASAHRLLCDGGTQAAMQDYVAGALAELHQQGKDIDLLYVSHIDQDHIGGVLTLLETAMEWKVYDFHDVRGDPPRPPKMPRMPRVKGLWHNAFRDLIKDNLGPIEDLLAASAPALQASRVPALAERGHEYAQIANSIPEALKVSRLSQPELLDIPVNMLAANPQYSGKLLLARQGQAVEQLGSLNITILCPTHQELEDLRSGWNNWLRDPRNKATARAIRDRYAQNLVEMAAGSGRNPLDLRDWEGMPDYEGVTVPNVASLVLLVEEAGKTVLLTGDSHPDKILAGLEQAGWLDQGYLHLDVLKFPHHGSEHNMTEEFGKTISADNYIFCGNGEHTNPELSVLDAVLASRLGPKGKRAKSPESASRPFTFWFNTTSADQTRIDAVEHMKKVEKWAATKLAKYPGLFDVKFIDGTHETLVL